MSSGAGWDFSVAGFDASEDGHIKQLDNGLFALFAA
jgi:hypothetical protein